MAKPKFYLEVRPSNMRAINMFYSFNGQRLQYYTGIRILESYYQEGCLTSNTIKPISSKAPYAAQYNEKLKAMAHDAVSIVHSAKGDDLNKAYVREQLDLIYKPKTLPEPEIIFQHNFISFFEQTILDMISGKRVISIGPNEGSRFKIGTIKNYNTTIAMVKKFLAYHGIDTLSFEQINKSFYTEFRSYCYEIEKKEISTFSTYIKIIKSVMGEGSPETFKAKDFIKPKYEADTVSLKFEQIDKIANLDLSDYSEFFEYKKDQETIAVGYGLLDKVRDLFLIGAYSGLRWGNYGNMDIKSVEGDFIKLKQVKGGERVSIYVMNKLSPVLAKYKDGFPTLSNQKFNELIKHVAQMAGLTNMIEIKSFRGGIEKKESFPLYTQISSHTCRRSYATNMFNLGIQPMLIMSATGHKRLETFLLYVKATNEDKSIMLGEAIKKLGL